MARKRRIAYVLPGFCSDADDPCIPVVTTFVRTMAVRHDVTVYTGEYPYRRKDYTVHGIDVRCTGTTSHSRLAKLNAWRKAGARIGEDHRQAPFDLIHGFWATLPGLVAARTAHSVGIPSVVSLAGGEPARYPEFGYGSGLSRWSRRVVARSLETATHITAGSNWIACMAEERYGRKPTAIPLGLNPELFSPGTLRTGRRLLAAAAMIPVKDYSTLIRGFAAILDSCPEATLTCVGWNGDGRERENVERLIDATGTRTAVAIEGEIRHDRMPEIFRNHDLFLHTSRHEAQGMAILEALATGMPVVATDVGIVPDLPEGLVRRFAPGDAEQLARIALDSLAGPRHADEALREGPELIRTEFDAERVADRFCDLYENLLRSGNV